MMDSCCKDCENRKPGCHDTCKAYKVYCIVLEVKRARDREQAKIRDYEAQRVIRNRDALKGGVRRVLHGK